MYLCFQKERNDAPAAPHSELAGPLGLWARRVYLLYVYRLTSLKYLIYSMNLLKPAPAASCACAGTLRMGLGWPLPSSLGTAGAHGHLAGMGRCGHWERGGGQDGSLGRRQFTHGGRRRKVRQLEVHMAPAGQQR
ncbi:MAG: hypothetical protein IJU72_00235 [Bacteroidales bacterium]|nr:hypothetical protein [Bacteroidales bacterium]